MLLKMTCLGVASQCLALCKSLAGQRYLCRPPIHGNAILLARAKHSLSPSLPAPTSPSQLQGASIFAKEEEAQSFNSETKCYMKRTSFNCGGQCREKR